MGYWVIGLFGLWGNKAIGLHDYRALGYWAIGLLGYRWCYMAFGRVGLQSLSPRSYSCNGWGGATVPSVLPLKLQLWRGLGSAGLGASAPTVAEASAPGVTVSAREPTQQIYPFI